jgi:hypothetical protein
MKEIHLRKRRHIGAAALGLGALMLGSTGFADAPLRPQSSGDHHKGSLALTLRRGSDPPFETFLPTLMSNCQGEVALNLSWNEDENWVNIKLKGEHVLQPNPSITRTEGVNFLPNPFFPEEQSYTNGRYLFWFIAPAPLITVYYDPVTLDMIGTEFELPTPPPGAIPLQLPGIKLFPTPFVTPDAEGNIDFSWTFAYDHCVRGDLPQFAHILNTYPPTNLCLANPVRYDLSTTRPYASHPLPASEALSFSDFLLNGLIFDNTIEPPEYYAFDTGPLVTQISVYSAMVINGGGAPKGWAIDLNAVFMNNFPPIMPDPFAGTCEDSFTGFHTPNINFCGP